MAMTVSDEGIALIASFEGFSGTLYNDPSGNCTIGYGFLVHLGKCQGAPSEQQWQTGITEEQGLRLLDATVQSYADAVLRLTTVPLTQNQFDALTSFTYNVGTGGYLDSSVRTVLNQGNYGGVCDELKKYIHGSDGVALPGLIRRRQAECNLFSRQEDDDMKPFMCWDTDRQRAYLIGPFGAAWITKAADVTTLEGLYGKTQVALSASTIDAIIAG